jgi:hypothetical protein
MAHSENKAAARPGAPRRRKAPGRHRIPPRTVGQLVAGPADLGPPGGPLSAPLFGPGPTFASEIQALQQLQAEAQQAPASPSVQAYLNDLNLQIQALTGLESDYQMLSIGGADPPPWWVQGNEAAQQQLVQLQQATQQAEQDAQGTPVAQADASVQPGIAAQAAALQVIATTLIP